MRPMEMPLNLFSKNAIGLCITDPDGICLEVNDYFCEVLGIQKTQLIQKSFLEISNSSQKKSWMALFEKLRKADTNNIEFTFKKNNDSEVFLRVNSEWVKAEDANDRLYISFQECTEKKQLELIQTHQNENEWADFKALINNMPDIFYSLDMDLKLINFNKAFNEISIDYFGHTPMLGDSPVIIMSKVDKARLKQFTSKAQKGAHFSFEDKISKNHIETYFDVSVNPIVNDDGHQIGISVFAKNITNRKLAEKEVKEKEALLNAMIQSMHEGVALVNTRGELLIYNAGIDNVLGISANDINKTDWLSICQFYDPETNALIPANELPIQKALDGIKTIRQEFLVKNPLRGDVYILCSGIPIRDFSGEVIAAMTVEQEVTETKLALRNTKLSNERYEYVTKATFDAIWDLNLISDELYWGEGFRSLFGYETVDNKGDIVVWYEHIHSEDRQRILDSINSLIKGKERNWVEEYRFMKANGEMAFVRNKGIVIRDAKGRGIRMIGAMQDITAFKKEEEQLKLFKSVITNTTDSVLITEAEFIEMPGPRILYVNESFTKMTGYTMEEIIGKTPRILHGPLTERTELERLKLALNKKEPCEIELVNYKKNGESFWTNISVVPLINEKGINTHWISIQKDITQKKNEEIEKEFFYELLQTINNNEILELSLSILIEKICNYFKYSYAEAWLINVDGIRMLFRANWAKDDVKAKFRTYKTIDYVELGQGVIGKAWEEKKILYFDDIQESDSVSKLSAEKTKLTSVLAVPIILNDRVIGVFTFFNDQPFTFNQISSDLLNKISKQIGSDIQKSRTEDELNRFFNLSPDLLCIVGFDGYFKKINQAVIGLLGYTEAELLTNPTVSFLHSGDREKRNKTFKKLIGGDRVVNFENRYLTKSGEIKWLSWTAVPIIGEEVVFAVAKDITYKKQLEIERENILDSISDCFYALDKAFNFTYVNAAAQALLKKTSDELIGKNLFDIYPVLREGLFYRNLEKVVSNKKPVHFEIYFEGSMDWYEESFYPTEEGMSVFFRSINNRKRIESEIKAAYEEKNTILESITDGFLTIDKSFKVTYINKEAERMLKISREGFVGKALRDTFPEVLAPEPFAQYTHALQDNVAVHFENYFESLNALFEVSAYPSELGLSIYFKDITKTKQLINLEQLEKEVLERNANPDNDLSKTIEYYLSEIEKIHVGMIGSVLRLENGRLFNWAAPSLPNEYINFIEGGEIGDNQGSCGTAAYLKQKIIVSDIGSDIRWKNYKDIALQFGLKACWSYPIISGGKVLGTFALYYKEKKSPTLDEEITIVRAVNILKVIIENKLFEREILEMNERYDLVTKATNDIIWDWNINTDDVFRTGDGLKEIINLDSNPEFRKSVVWLTRVHSEDLASLKEKLRQFLGDPGATYWSSAYRFLKDDGTYAHFLEKGYLTRNEKKEPVRMIGATRDITKQKETEIVLKQLNEKLKKRAEELADSNIELERFAYVASHDLQEPLRMVTSFLQLLQKKYEPQLDETANKYIELAVDGASRMKNLINDLLQFSRVSSSTIVLSQVDTNEIVTELKELFKIKLQQTGGDIIWSNLPVIKADKTPITQLMQNLIGNALKYRSEMPPVIKIKCEEELLFWKFSFEDNGIGIDPKFFDKIFVIFQRLHNKDEYSGTGIGLAICKKIVERFDGKIWLTSKPGKGSTFYFSIPK